MDTPVTVAVISASAAVVVPAISFYLTKRKERAADWQKYKFEQYRELISALSGIVGTDSSPEGNRRFTEVSNTVQLLASGAVITALHAFRDESPLLTRTNRKSGTMSSYRGYFGR